MHTTYYIHHMNTSKLIKNNTELLKHTMAAESNPLLIALSKAWNVTLSKWTLVRFSAKNQKTLLNTMFSSCKRIKVRSRIFAITNCKLMGQPQHSAAEH